MWGFNHLIFLPRAYTILYIVLGLFALLTPLFSTSLNWGILFTNWLSKIFFESPRKYYNRLIFIVSCIILFFLFPMPNHFLGDGYALLSNLASPRVSFAKWTEKGATMVLLAVQALLGGKNEATSLLAFRIVSAISGGVAIWFFFLVAEIISKDHWRRIWIFSASLFSGVMLLFFGYVENYPMLWIGLSGFIYFSLKYLVTGKGFWASSLFFLFGFFIHLKILVFLPAYIFVIIRRGKGRALYDRFKVIFWILVGIAALISISLILKKYRTDLYFENMFLPLFSGKPIDPSYFVFSLSHLLDCLNMLLILSPFLFLFLVLSSRGIFEFLRRDITIFLAIASVGNLLFLFLIDPTLTMPRDWDLFSLEAFCLTLLIVILMPRKIESSALKIMGSSIILLAIISLPYLLTNLNNSSSIEYTKYIINNDKEKSMTTVMLLRDFYKKQDDKLTFDSLNNIINASYPNYIKTYTALAALDNGDNITVNKLLPTIVPNKFSKDYHRMLASYYAQAHNYHQALAEAKSAISLQKYYIKSYYILADIYFRMQQYDSAMQTLRVGYDLANNDPYILKGIASLFLQGKQIDSSIFYATALIKVDSTNYDGYYYLAIAFSIKKQTSDMLDNIKLYRQFGSSDPYFETRIRELDKM